MGAALAEIEFFRYHCETDFQIVRDKNLEKDDIFTFFQKKSAQLSSNGNPFGSPINITSTISGGALGIGIGDRVLMLENTWYSVISPESCSSILWRSWDFKEKAAEVLKLTAEDMLRNKLIDGIIREPMGGAHTDPEGAFKNVKEVIKSELAELIELVEMLQKFCAPV